LYQATSNNNNHAFYSQASWGRLEIKPHEKKKQGQNKGEKDRGKQRAIKNQIEKGEKIEKGESATSIVIQKKHKSHLSRKRLLRFSLFASKQEIRYLLRVNNSITRGQTY
jgi:hypothetical protein